MPVSTAAPHSAFTHLRSETIASLNLTVEHYQHTETGAIHYHLDSDLEENVFLVAFRTVPVDSRGVAHILEHTALCGSKKYPVRDPFFMMIRRSLNTFMNAFTSSDWTAYPFASQNRKDFNNLLDVYLDATFFSRLDELDFAQEGHRLEFTEADNPKSELVYKGVVFNEMKGAMSSAVDTLYQTLTKYLFPSSTYHHNSGGDPQNIPELSYQQLQEFYKTHYHPSNAVFMTFGNIPAAQHQQKIHDQALHEFSKLDHGISVNDEQRYLSPVAVEEYYGVDDANDDAEEKTHLVLGWLLGDSTDLKAQLEAQFLEMVLLENSAAPLRHALETSKLGSAPSPLCGLEDSNKEMAFMCGLEGGKAEDAVAFQQMVLETLQQVVEQGVEQSRLDAILHQLELHQREIGGDGYPYGLQLILSSISSAIHGGDVIAHYQLDEALEELREELKDSNFVANLVTTLLLDNQHRVRLSLIPDGQLNQRKVAAETSKLAKIKAELSEQGAQDIIDQTAALNKRQAQQDDMSILPKVGLTDVPEDLSICQGNTSNLKIKHGDLPLSYFAQGTNGLVYQQLIFDLPELSDEQLQLVPFYTQLLTSLAVEDRDYRQVQAWHSAISGGISAFIAMRGATDSAQKMNGYFVLSGKALARNSAELSQLLQKTLTGIRFDEHTRIKEIVAQRRARVEQSITGSGHSLAMSCASSGLSAMAAYNHKLHGLHSVTYIQTLDDSFSQPEAVADFAQQLAELHQHVIHANLRLLVVAEAEHENKLKQELQQYWQDYTNNVVTRFTATAVDQQIKQAWTTSTQVNFCAKAYPTVTVDHADSAALTVLGGFLRNGYLHGKVREQGGAYGGGASQESNISAFRFYSYRDPRLSETLDDFDQSLVWLAETEHDFAALEEAILGVISSIDKPGSPAGEAKQAFHNELHGRNPEQRKAFRNRILKVTIADLKQVAATYLQPQKASIAVICNAESAQALAEQGYQVTAL